MVLRSVPICPPPKYLAECPGWHRKEFSHCSEKSQNSLGRILSSRRISCPATADSNLKQDPGVPKWQEVQPHRVPRRCSIEQFDKEHSKIQKKCDAALFVCLGTKTLRIQGGFGYDDGAVDRSDNALKSSTTSSCSRIVGIGILEPC